MKRRIVLAFFLSVAMVLVLSCGNNEEAFDPLKQWEQEVAVIDSYLTTNNIVAEKDLSGVRMVITELGDKLPATLNNSVEVTYVGKFFPNGATFDQGTTENDVTRYIDGWKIALTTLPSGSKATVYIPSYFGYGNVAQGPIPANSILQFDIHVKKVVTSSAELQQFGKDTTAIDSYLAAKGIAAVKDTTGIRYVITQEGTGPTADWYDQLKLNFSLRLFSDDTQQVFTHTGEPNAITASRNIDYNYLQGLMIGLQKMRAGGKATLYVPSTLAYKSAGAKNNNVTIVPPDTNVIVDVELVEILP
jgi:FKBP-type peptidyl-prolyl cis-trans isomerase